MTDIALVNISPLFTSCLSLTRLSSRGGTWETLERPLLQDIAQ